MSNELCHSFRIRCKSRSVCVIGQWHLTIEVGKFVKIICAPIHEKTILALDILNHQLVQ